MRKTTSLYPQSASKVVGAAQQVILKADSKIAEAESALRQRQKAFDALPWYKRFWIVRPELYDEHGLPDGIEGCTAFHWSSVRDAAKRIEECAKVCGHSVVYMNEEDMSTLLIASDRTV